MQQTFIKNVSTEMSYRDDIRGGKLPVKGWEKGKGVEKLTLSASTVYACY
jgi:hypothetical protein